MLPPRRGVTLLEMLVAVALLILMMTVVTSIFQAATGAITVAKTLQELDGELRQLDSVIRQDLNGATADNGTGPLTPPFDPNQGLGYFELGEGQFADLQAEDSDDYIRFTVKAPEGQPFTGRMWIGPMFETLVNGTTIANQPVMIQSQFAEVIYFLRNGNLYRRVFLIAPERQQAVNAVFTSTASSGAGFLNKNAFWQFPVLAFNSLPGSWQGMNDLSARPSKITGTAAGMPPQLNTLGDLTNRECRAFYPRFTNSYLGASTGGQYDDIDPTGASTIGDSVPDWWPTLYPNVFNVTNPVTNLPLINPLANFPRAPNTKSNADFPDLMSFPYIFPGAFSQPDPTSGAYGLLHGMGSPGATGTPMALGQPVSNPNLPPPPYGYVYNGGTILLNTRSATGATALNLPNHNPIPTGDTLTTPDPVNGPLQTWWAFPTWKETISPNWADPVYTLPTGSGAQAPGLSWSTVFGGSAVLATPFNAPLPPLTNLIVDLQQYTDQLGNSGGTNNFSTPNVVFRDDIIMQGVRSFDVKVYDDTVPGYVDLGYANLVQGVSKYVGSNAQQFSDAYLMPSMAHEGRIPPLTTDLRPDPNYSKWTPNVGDDTAGINRLRRVWDTWSTDYSNAPANGFLTSAGAFLGPPMSVPVYPSYPPPYPAPLRGIQIQIRVTDPRNERVKVLTIRHSFIT